MHKPSFQRGRSEVIILYPFIYTYIYIHMSNHWLVGELVVSLFDLHEQCSKPMVVDDYRGLYYPSYIGEYNNPIGESLLTIQYNGIMVVESIDSLKQPRRSREHSGLPRTGGQGLGIKNGCRNGGCLKMLGKHQNPLVYTFFSGGLKLRCL